MARSYWGDLLNYVISYQAVFLHGLSLPSSLTPHQVALTEFTLDKCRCGFLPESPTFWELIVVAHFVHREAPSRFGIHDVSVRNVAEMFFFSAHFLQITSLELQSDHTHTRISASVFGGVWLHRLVGCRLEVFHHVSLLREWVEVSHCTSSVSPPALALRGWLQWDEQCYGFMRFFS